MSEQVVELKGVSKWYPGAEDRKVLQGIDLSIAKGQRFSVVGPSGCGKSTLLNILGTLDQPSGGQVIFEGRDLQGANEKELASLRSQQIGFIFQLHHLLPQCSALENVLIPTLALAQRPDEAEVKERAQHLLKRMGLGEHLHSRPAQMSGGERQRVAVVRALINQPSLILADEPTGALDEDNAERLMDLLIELNEEESVALVLVTHDLDLAKRTGDVRNLREGQLGG
ncbi:MAG: ABC transporter ATP-binding protein [Verrucomicrobiales bacterium]|nr:ABC transporter ATP-binding protein [Verrucomicrobiales bacterium]